MRAPYRDWDEMTAKVVAYLRLVLGADLDDPRLSDLIGELTVRSERFRTLWARHDVRLKTGGLTRMLHPRVGALDLRYEKLELPGAGQTLITYHAEPGSASERRRRRPSAPADGALDEHGARRRTALRSERVRARQVKVWYKNRHPFLVTPPHRRIGR